MQKLLDAGAIVFGKTNLHELAYGITNNNAAFGPARNPYDPSRIPGASSGGVGVAVAARMAPGGIGSDTGGSVRIPAALCGIVGFRPTTGRWSQAGIVPISHTRDTAGPMTRSVADCELLDGVVTGSKPAAAVALKGLRLGVPRAHFWAPLDSEVARLMEGVLATLKEAGAVLVEADVADVGRLDNEAGFPIALYETVVDLDAYLAGHGSPLGYRELVAQCASPDVAGLLQSLHGAGAIPAAAYRHALDVQRPQLQAAYRDHFARHDLAALVFPTTPLAAAPIGDDETVALNGERVPTFPTFIRNCEPGQRRRHSGNQPARGAHPGGLARSASSSTARKEAMPGCWRSPAPSRRSCRRCRRRRASARRFRFRERQPVRAAATGFNHKDQED